MSFTNVHCITFSEHFCAKTLLITAPFEYVLTFITILYFSPLAFVLFVVYRVLPILFRSRLNFSHRFVLCSPRSFIHTCSPLLISSTVQLFARITSDFAEAIIGFSYQRKKKCLSWKIVESRGKQTRLR